MAFHLVGVDPQSPDDKCCAVFVDDEADKIYFQGKLVTDPEILARIAKESPIGADEAVVWHPGRMKPTISEAIAGTFEAGRVGHGPTTIRDMLRGVRHSAVHLETRDTYDPAHPAFQDFLGGGTGRYDRSGWTGVVRETVARGVRIRRARVVSEPISDYIRWEHLITDENIEAGEEVRWLPRRQAYDLALPGTDFWMFDGRVVCFNFNSGAGVDTDEDQFTNDPATVTRCIAMFEQVWERAIPHADYRPR
ncbi:DUF6879 family protein [Nonomuraea endophytica]|uniref:DUF6879 domain-containing protein n=1 Tax=Nonomuraea endophytica TaxID=714136 RepID=A0A7W8EI82_9ACTN|nr:DUF6879 family protein [Nonomuraea endophytica]MBB5080273.1 hypothetical protein [Nonomuraea endophytica]